MFEELEFNISHYMNPVMYVLVLTTIMYTVIKKKNIKLNFKLLQKSSIMSKEDSRLLKKLKQ